MLAERSAGILLHPTSLPSRGGIGDLGPEAYAFVDFLAAARQRLWQILPLSPPGLNNSPYSAISAFAGNPLLISLDRLAERGWIASDRVAKAAAGAPKPGERIDFEGLALDQASHCVLVGDQTVPLGPTEYRMLEFFMTHPERVYTRDQLLDRIWGGNVYVEERTIDVHIRRLRKALEDFGYDRFVQTVRGSGYRFSARTI